MSDIEKGQGVTTTNGPANFPGPGAGQHGGFVTLGATAEQQQYYQGGAFGLRKLANPAPLCVPSFTSRLSLLSLHPASPVPHPLPFFSSLPPAPSSS